MESTVSVPTVDDMIYVLERGKIARRKVTASVHQGDDYSVSVFGISGAYSWNILGAQQPYLKAEYHSQSTLSLVD